tara:strand:- start:155 stop:1021 length:867 start_codon:yes stop_codon:yes gene_type:complete
MKGIILAGGAGTRLYPITKVVSKQLLPVYNKPMIYYPLSMLMLSGIRDVLIISTPQDILNYENLLGDGKSLGISIKYKIQKAPNGLAEAFIIGEDFIGNDDVCLILGDNIFYGKSIPTLLKRVSSQLSQNKSSIIFGYAVNDPQRYGVVEFDEKFNVVSIEEKPEVPKSNYAVVGLYFYKNEVVDLAKQIKPSKRGELEITSLNLEFLNQNKLEVNILDSVFWLDTGTHEALVEASNFIRTIENREDRQISCLEEIAYKYNYIDKGQLQSIIDSNHYNSDYLKKIINS